MILVRGENHDKAEYQKSMNVKLTTLAGGGGGGDVTNDVNSDSIGFR